MSARRVVVVGAGAAGLTAALRAAEAGAAVTLLNAHPVVGLKILMSGGTRCNVTHREVSERDYHGGSRKVIARILRAFPAEQTREWFESLGVELKIEEDGRCFPASNDARTVLEALSAAVRRAGVTLEAAARVVRIERLPQPGPRAADAAGPRLPQTVPAAGEVAGARLPPPAPALDRWRLGIQTVHSGAAFPSAVAAHARSDWPLPAVEPDRWLEADAVVLATGGLSYPRTGTDGTGYALAAALGHTIVPPVPALTPLASEDPLCRTAQGVTLDAELSLWVDGRREVVVKGSLLITHFGYSGPAALDLSRHWLRAATARERRVIASFVPGMTPESALAAWVRAATEQPHTTVRQWLGQRLPERLAAALCEEAEVDPASLVGQVDRTRRAALLGRLTARELPVTGTLGYEKAEVTAGGVPLDEVDPSTLESRKAPGVYLCGEMLDVDGRLGGFNFQWAWSSGTVAGRAAAKG